MQYFQIAWLVRYIILATAECSSLLVILVVLIGGLNRYTSCLLIFLMQICYAIVNANALLYTDRFSALNIPQISPSNPSTTQQPWNGLCLFESYLIHSSWMISFYLSLVLVTFEYWILSNKLYGRKQYKSKMMWSCLIVPLLVNAVPFLYPEYGFGPNGFNIPGQGGEWEPIYFFCGWKSPLIYDGSSQQLKQQLAYGLNFMLPLFLGLIYQVYLLVMIRRAKRRMAEQGITLSKQQQYITNLHRVPFTLFIILLVNMVIRLIPFLSLKWPEPIRYLVLFWDFAFDLIPILSSYQFFRFVKSSLVVPRLKWLSRTEQPVSLITERSDPVLQEDARSPN